MQSDSSFEPRLVRRAPWGVAILVATVAACGGGGGGGDGGGATTNSLDTALVALGVSTAQTPREDADGDAMPASYSPFGATWKLGVTNEILFIGLDMNATGRPVSLVDVTADNGAPTIEALTSQSAAQAPWANETGASQELPQTLRAATNADFDGDGLEAAAIVYQQGLELHVVRVEDEPSGFATTDSFVGLEFGVTNVAARAIDVDGDGKDELAVGLTQDDDGVLVFMRATQLGFEHFGPRIPFPRQIAGSTLWIQIATGNIDHDIGEELLVTVNEERRTPPAPVQATRYHVFDDASAGFVQLSTGAVEGPDQSNIVRTALVASPAIGDVDGDGMGEVLLGGLTRFGRQCDGGDYFLFARDDADHGCAQVAGRFFSHSFDDCDSPADPQVRTVHLSALDVDGDGRDEVRANFFGFQDFVAAAPWTPVAGWQLPETALYRAGDHGYFDFNTSAVVCGDFSGDAREDVAIFREDASEIAVWGVLETSMPSTITKLRSIPTAFTNSQTPRNPVLLPVNVDTDSPVLKYDQAEYKLVFSEPIVLAALAAAPFKNGIGQNVAACRTTFGNMESTSNAHERTVSITASASVGVSYEDQITQSGFDLKLKLSGEASRVTSEAYSLSKTILFTSGSAEDLVVFTSVPLDQYTFTVVSHPDPALVGHKVVVNLPRDPVTRQAERGFYNDAIPENGTRVDDQVFGHVIGDPLSYPTRTDKTFQMLQTGGLEVGPIGVGQGSGETEVSLQVGTEIGAGSALELGFELDLEVTLGGFVGGLTVGASAEDAFRVTSGQETTYTGVVGAIDAAHFAANQYSFGLFTYVYRVPGSGREFEVLNYWIE
jgi:hypothetical protein